MNRRELLRHALAGTTLALGWRPGAAAPDDLIRKKIPGTDETVPVIGVGTNRYAAGDAALEARLEAALSAFTNLGGTVIDTAPMYRSSETILGQLIDKLGIRDQLFLATKSDRGVKDGGIQRLENSFTALRSKQLDLVQSHNMLGIDTMLRVLLEMQQADRIRYIGVTTSRTSQFKMFEAVMASQALNFIQVNYSLADRTAEQRILPLAQERGMAVLVNLPLGRGRLFQVVGNRSLPGWTKEFDCSSWAQFFLKFVVSHPAVTCAIPGMTRPEHVIDNFGAAVGRLPNAQQRERQVKFIQSL